MALISKRIHYILFTLRNMLWRTMRFIGRNIIFKVPLTIVNIIKMLWKFTFNPKNARKVVALLVLLTLAYISALLIEDANKKRRESYVTSTKYKNVFKRIKD